MANQAIPAGTSGMCQKRSWVVPMAGSAPSTESGSHLVVGAIEYGDDCIEPPKSQIFLFGRSLAVVANVRFGANSQAIVHLGASW